MAPGGPWVRAKYSHGVWERFPDQANPFLNNFFLTLQLAHFESNWLISNPTGYTHIHEISLVSGTPLERRAPKNYANPRHKCAEISDFDPIRDKNVKSTSSPRIPNSGAMSRPQFHTHPPAINHANWVCSRMQLMEPLCPSWL